ncbi:MAG: hypothetical protein KGL63_00700 [Betaproteobacteria bacterium]|nr:hypothetical protein [Betaproteobacteria bacterium]
MIRFPGRPRWTAATLALGLAALGFASISAMADEHRHREGPRGGYHEFREHDVRRFPEHELALWRTGLWRHEWHDGRYGWWWFVAGVWYFYERPVYPYPMVVAPVTYVAPVTGPNLPGPPVSPQGTTLMPPPGAPQSYYYCDSARGYYPAVPQCPEPWRVVPVAPPAPMQPPQPPAPGAPYGPPPPGR